MTLQVLVAAIDQTDFSLVKKMNIRTAAIVGNQGSRNAVETTEAEGHTVTYLNFAERGVGLNRNNALMRADADICLLADDDMVYDDDYEAKVLEAFRQYPEADVIFFNLEEENSTRYRIDSPHKVGRLNFLRYGAARTAFRLDRIRENGIFFNQCFGGGCRYSHGEDSIFFSDCLRKGLRLMAVPVTIGRMTHERASTWLGRYDETYRRDQGALYRQISRRFWRFLCLQDALRKRKRYGLAPLRAYRLMTKGAGR